MRLHENPTLFRQSVEFTSQKLNIPEIYVEKDYWVTYALHLVFQNQIGTEAVFKGGPALSKCFGIIERFSEDIDLVVLRREGENPTQLKRKLKAVTTAVSEHLEEIHIDGITNKVGMIRKIAYNYKKVFKGVFGQVRDVIIVEATWLGRYEPYNKQEISSYIYEMMQEANQLVLAKEYGMLPFEVQVLHVNRTICEKIMSLVRFSYGEDPLADLKKKIRHTYDIHQLLQISASYPRFLRSPHHDVKSLIATEVPKIFRRRLVSGVNRLIPSIDVDAFNKRGSTGIRAQLLHKKTGRLEMDFVLRGDEKSAHILNAVSPAWTSSLSFASYAVDNMRL